MLQGRGSSCRRTCRWTCPAFLPARQPMPQPWRQACRRLPPPAHVLVSLGGKCRSEDSGGAVWVLVPALDVADMRTIEVFRRLADQHPKDHSREGVTGDFQASRLDASVMGAVGFSRCLLMSHRQPGGEQGFRCSAARPALLTTRVLPSSTPYSAYPPLDLNLSSTARPCSLLRFVLVSSQVPWNNASLFVSIQPGPATSSYRPSLLVLCLILELPHWTSRLQAPTSSWQAMLQLQHAFETRRF